jgi:transposase InsO family protein
VASCALHNAPTCVQSAAQPAVEQDTPCGQVVHHGATTDFVCDTQEMCAARESVTQMEFPLKGGGAQSRGGSLPPCMDALYRSQLPVGFAPDSVQADAGAVSFPICSSIETVVPRWLAEPWMEPEVLARLQSSEPSQLRPEVVPRGEQVTLAGTSPAGRALTTVQLRRRDSFSGWLEGAELSRADMNVDHTMHSLEASSSASACSREGRACDWPHLCSQVDAVTAAQLRAVKVDLKRVFTGLEGDLELMCVQLRPARCIKLRGKINGQWVTILVDSGASQSFVDSTVATSLGLKLQPARLGDRLLKITLADGSAHTASHVASVTWTVGQYTHTDVCVCTTLHGEDLILGMPWLEAVNPRVDWVTQVLRVRDDRRRVRLLRGMSAAPDLISSAQALLTSGSDSQPPSSDDLLISAHAACDLVRDGSDAWALSGCIDTGYVLVPLGASAARLSSAEVHLHSSAVVAAVGQPKPPPEPPPVGEFDCSDPQLKSIIRSFPRLFMNNPGGVVDRAVQLELTEKPDMPQPRMPGMRRYSQPELEEIERFVADLEAKGWIVPAPNAPYAAPTVLVKKKDGGWRCAIDYRFTVNTLMQQDSWPLPRIDGLLDKLHGKPFLSAIDVRDAFYAVPTRPGDEVKLAWSTPARGGSVWAWRVMPQGVKMGPAVFSRLMSHICGDFIAEGWCLVYLDDVLIASRTLAEHRSHVQRLLQRLQDNQLYLKLSKCQWLQQAFVWLGHKITTTGIMMDDKKIAAVRDWPAPSGKPAQCKKALRSFLGLAGYYRRFVRDYAHVAAPLTDLTKDDTSWVWGDREQAAFEQLKAALIADPVMQAPDHTRPFIVHTDASDLACGAVLSQLDPATSTERVICYYSHRFSEAESKWPAHERELFAVVQALKEWRHHLLGREFTLFTDNAAVSYVLKQKVLTPKQARWVQTLAEYEFNLVHKPGKLNVVADALSRRQDYEVREEVTAKVMHASLVRSYMQFQASVALHALSPSWEAVTLAALDADLAAEAPAAPEEFQGDPPDPPEDVRPGARLMLDPQWVARLKSDAELDSEYQKLLATARTHSEPHKHGFAAHDGLLFDMRPGAPRLCVPRGKFRLRLLREAHDRAGHFGRDKVLARLQQNFYWPRMDRTVDTYVRSCLICQQTKAGTHPTYGEARLLSVPSRPFERLGMDLITGLPTTATGFDAILVFICHLSKRVIIVPTHKSLTAEGFAGLYFEHVYKHWGLPAELVSDRGSIWTSQFWRTLAAKLKTKLLFSTAYHPQTDGQTERANRWIEDALRCYVSNAQTDWADWLPAIEFQINSARQASTGKTPFELSIGVQPRSPLDFIVDSFTIPRRCVGALDKEQEWRNALEYAQLRIREAKFRQAKYYNRNKKPLELAVGMRVYLSTKNLRHPKGTVPKLGRRKIGPFPVTRIINEVAAELDLSSDPALKRVFNVFHVSLLEPAVERPADLQGSDSDEDAPPPPLAASEEELEAREEEPAFFPERIAATNPATATSHSEVTEYQVKWKGYTAAHNTWEPAARFHEDATELIQAFWAAKAKRAAAALLPRKEKPPPKPAAPSTRVWESGARAARKPVDPYLRSLAEEQERKATKGPPAPGMVLP